MRRWLAIAVMLLGLALTSGRPAAAADFGGIWKLMPTAPADAPEPRDVILKLQQEGEKLRGTLIVQGKERPIMDATVQGNALQFKVSVDEDGEARTATVRATLEGDRLKGTVEGARPAVIAFTATRQAVGALAGRWSLTVTSTEKVRKATLIIVQDGQKLTGTLQPEEGAELPLLDGALEGDTLRFEVEITMDGQQLRPRFMGKRTEKGIEGTVTVGDQSFSWSAERVSPAK
jgi:hypothetical protein